MASRRQYCAAATASRHELITLGGHDGTDYLSSVELYDTTEQSWKTLPPMRHGKQLLPRHGCAVTSVQGDVYAIGGFDGQTSLAIVQKCVKDSRVWRSQPSLRTKRTGCCAVAIGRKLFVLGGYDGQRALPTCEMLDLDGMNKWMALPPMSSARNRCAAAVIHDGAAIVVVGGNDGQEALASVEVFDVATSVWRTLPTKLQKKRSGCGLVVVSSSTPADGVMHSTKSTAAAAINTSTSTASTNAVPTRPSHCRRCQHLLAIGGIDNDRALRSVEICDLETLQWHPAKHNLVHAREGCAAVMMAHSNRVVVVGGFDGKNDLHTAEELLLEKVVPDMPVLPPIPFPKNHPNDVDVANNSDSALAHSVAALESWKDHVLNEQKTLQNNVATATARLQTEFGQTKSLLEKEIKKRQKELLRLQTKLQDEEAVHKERLQGLADDTATWNASVDQQVTTVGDRIKGLLRELEFRQTKRKLERREAPPPELVCCITLELMRDPVIAVADGHTYERHAIEKVFANSRGRTCRSPRTGQAMDTRQLVSNVAIRAMCRDYADRVLGNSCTSASGAADVTDIAVGVAKRKES